MRYAIVLALFVGCAAPRVSGPAAIPLTWTAVGFGLNVARCLEAYGTLTAEARARWCNCYIPEVMRASPDPVGQITSAEVDAATRACAAARPTEEDVEAEESAPPGVSL
jgi:hypothetical protein